MGDHSSGRSVCMHLVAGVCGARRRRRARVRARRGALAGKRGLARDRAWTSGAHMRAAGERADGQDGQPLLMQQVQPPIVPICHLPFVGALTPADDVQVVAR